MAKAPIRHLPWEALTSMADQSELIHPQRRLVVQVVTQEDVAEAEAAVAEASKAGFDTDSVAQQINYGFAGDVGVSPPMDHRIDETGVSVPEGFGDEDEAPKKK